MDKETFEALRRIMLNVADVNDPEQGNPAVSDVNKVFAWMDEVAKEYDE